MRSSGRKRGAGAFEIRKKGKYYRGRKRREEERPFLWKKRKNRGNYSSLLAAVVAVLIGRVSVKSKKFPSRRWITFRAEKRFRAKY